MGMFMVRKRHIGIGVIVLAFCYVSQQSSYASTFGAGVFGANVPFGSLTSISIALSNNVAITMAANGGTLQGTGSHSITVTSTDVVGYDLYINATAATSMDNGASTIPASANATAAPLSLNSWGYNTTGSTTDFKGITTTQSLINSGTGPFTGGDITPISYGALIDMNKASGVYAVDVTYTAVGRN